MLIHLEHIRNFSPALTTILSNELKLGNELVETAKGWPHESSIILFLRRPFQDEYTLEGIEYRVINDIHYWESEYFDPVTNHILACKFA